MDYAAAKVRQDDLYAANSTASKALNTFIDQFGRGPMGLTPDHVKTMPEYRALRASYDRSAVLLRQFNAWFTRQFSKEIRAARKARIAMMESMIPNQQEQQQ
ncbi:conserved hypothetical protein [Paraburkholderia tropica]|uniref:hypothetical protein n=1 Tax=Paraburkholderia tropica TaxID=92647 RepID=UPI001CAEBB0E|nr:hypothetical protein [Paraburkholderia tropica]CAG9229869.1 conserved hypothetical protein [Paraburkholderia tropica]